MKFLNETFDTGLTITEEVNESTGKKNLYIVGPFMSYDTPNRNGRIYNREILVKEAMRFKKEVVDKNSALMEMGHPDSLTINPERVCARIVDLWEDVEKKAIMGKALVIENVPMGNLLKGILEAGTAWGVSTRGAGSLKKNSQGLNEVQSDFKIATVDAVLNPSGINCFVNPVMESKEFAYENGQFIELTDEVLEKMGYEKKVEKIDEEKKPSKEEKLLACFDKLYETLSNPRLEYEHHSKKYNEHMESMHAKTSKLAGMADKTHPSIADTLDEIRQHGLEMQRHYGEMKALKKYLK